MRRSDEGDDISDLVTAAEIAAWVYCPEQWRLQYGEGHEPGNRQALDAGDRHHARNVAVERATGCAFALTRGVAVAGALLILILWLWR